jgi:hypothetical protein
LIGLSFESVTDATTVCGELAVTVADVEPLTVSEIVFGGHVEKNPAADVTSDVAALITVDPGRFAVATPFGFGVLEVLPGVDDVGSVVLLMFTTSFATALYVIVPTFALGLVQESVLGLQRVVPPGPVTVVSVSKDVDSVCPCDRHALCAGMVIEEIGGWIYTFTGLLVTAAPLAVTWTVPHVVELHPLNAEIEAPDGGVQMLKSGTPPGLFRFHVPAQIPPLGEISASSRLELEYV